MIAYCRHNVEIFPFYDTFLFVCCYNSQIVHIIIIHYSQTDGKICLSIARVKRALRSKVDWQANIKHARLTERRCAYEKVYESFGSGHRRRLDDLLWQYLPLIGSNITQPPLQGRCPTGTEGFADSSIPTPSGNFVTSSHIREPYTQKEQVLWPALFILLVFTYDFCSSSWTRCNTPWHPLQRVCSADGRWG